MKKHLLLTAFFGLVLATTSFSQSVSKDSITLTRKGLGEIKYYQANNKLTGKQVGNLLLSNPEATATWKKSRTNLTFAYIFGIIGGAMVGWELGNAISGKDVNGAVIGAGAGLVGVSIVFGINSDRKSKKAISLFNTAFR
jgi:hypothetical protein